jgi:hypothetical protein
MIMTLYHLNKNSNNYLAVALVLTAVIAATAVVLLSLITSIISSPAAAITTVNSTTTTTTIPSSEIELSTQPVYQEQIRNTEQSPINQAHLQITYAGNGTLNLPNSTETITIRTTSSGSGIASMMDNDFAGKEILTTEDGSESATARVYDLVRFSMQEGTGRGIVIAVFHTNSTGIMAPLDDIILAGTTELYPNATGLVTLWEWESGMPFLPGTTTVTTGESPPTNTTMTDSSSTDASIPSEQNEQWWQQFWDM